MSIIIGIVVGAGLYESTPQIARLVASPTALAAVWIAGGLMALVGAMCYAELTTAYPREGGDFVFLSRAFGLRAGFVFSWSQLWVVRPGSIGAMAYVFARYANELLPLAEERTSMIVYAAGSILALSLLNMLGVKQGKHTQNLLTGAKVVGLLGIFLLALVVPGEAASFGKPAPGSETNYKLAFILIMFTYGGWNDMSYVAAEVRNPSRNLVRALLLGTLAVTVIYLAVNFALVRLIGFEAVRNSPAVAADAVSAALGPRGGRMVSALVCISCLGAINGMIFTGARIYYATGIKHPMFRYLGAWNSRLETPLRSLTLQAATTMVAVVWLGLIHGKDPFVGMLVFTAPVFWFFITCSACALFVLRWTDSQTPRPYRVWAYPLIPVVFTAGSLFMLYSSCDYAWNHRSVEAGVGIALLILGVGLSLIEKRE